MPASIRPQARQDLADQLTILEKHTLTDKAWMNGARKGAVDIYAAIIMSWQPSSIDLASDHTPHVCKEATVWEDPLVGASFREQ